MTAQETNLVNAFETTLAAQLASGGTSMNLTDDPGVDSKAYFVIDPDNDSNREVVLWASGTNHAAATVTRDIDSKHGTDPTHAAGTKVRLAVVKQHFEDIHDRVDVIVNAGGTAVNTSGIVKDEDNMASNSASHLATQQSIKAYVDALLVDEDNFASDSATQPPSQQSVKAYIAAQGFADIGLIIALG